MKKLIAAVCILGALAEMLSGCQYSTEINSMALVMGIAVDKGEKENEYEVTAQIAKPEVIAGGKSNSAESNGENVGFLNISRTGIGVSAAMLDISKLINREFYTGHIQIVVISKEVAEEGVGPILDYFIGSTDGRVSTPLIVSGGKAKLLLEGQNPMDNSPASNLVGLLDAQIKAGEIGESSIATFLADVIGGLTAATIPVADIIADKNGVEFPEITGAAAFTGLKLSSVMTISQSRAVLSVRDVITGGFLKIEKDNEFLTLQLEKTSSKISAVIEGGKPVMKVRIVREYSVDDTNMDIDFLNDDEREKTEKLAEDHALGLFNNVLQWAREEKLDVFAFGEHLYRFHRKETRELLKNWQESFPDVEVRFQVEIMVLGSGAILRSLEPANEAGA